MKPFLLAVARFAAIQIAIAAVFAAAYRPDPQHYFAATLDKHRLLAEVPSPRVVLAGGSNLAFGLDCDSLAAALDHHPINMGLHAGLGVGFTLNEIRDGLRAGDAAVLSIEYEQFGVVAQPKIMLRLLSQRPAGVRDLPLDYWPKLLDYGLSYAGIVVRGGATRMRGLTDPLTPPYMRGAFNAFGDDTLRPATTKRPPFELPLFADGRIPGRFKASIEQINRFAAHCERRGVRVFFTHGVVPETRWKLHRPIFTAAESVVALRIRVPMLETPQEAVYPDRMFYDTEYHLTAEGVALRSQKLARALAERLNGPGE